MPASSRLRVRTLAATFIFLLLCFATSLSFATASKHKTSIMKAKAVSEQVLTALRPGVKTQGGSSSEGINPGMANGKNRRGGGKRNPIEGRMKRGRAFNGDLRTLPQSSPQVMERPELEEPEPSPVAVPGTSVDTGSDAPIGGGITNLNAPAPATSQNFAGLDFATWGAGHPPDTNGDVGPNHYIQTINTLDRHLPTRRRVPDHGLHLQHPHEPGHFRQSVRHQQFRRSGGALRHLRRSLGHHGLRFHFGRR